MVEPALPTLEPRYFVAIDEFDRMVSELRDEIALLELEVATIQAAIADAEGRLMPSGRPVVEASAVDAAEAMIQTWLAGERAAIRATIEEPKLRDAAHRILEARDAAAHSRAAASDGASGKPLEDVVEVEAPRIDVVTAGRTDGRPPLRIASACRRADEDVCDDSPDSTPTVGTDATRPAGTEATIDEEVPAPEPEVAAGGPTGEAEAEAFDAFWREEHEVSDSRRSFLRPLDFLLPMVLLVVLLTGVLFVI